MSHVGINAVLVLLENLGPIKPQPTKHSQSFKACCPAHDDKDPSLVVTELHDGRVLLKCWSGCGTVDILSALGQRNNLGDVDWSILFPDSEIRKKNRLESVFGPKPKRKLTDDDYILAIADADRKAGKRLTDSEKDRELLAYKRKLARFS